MLKKNKIFIILLAIFIIILLSLNNCVNAVRIPIDTVEGLLDDEYPYYFIFENPQSGNYYMVVSSVVPSAWGSGYAVLTGYSTLNTRIYKFTGVSWILEDINNIDFVKWRLDYVNRYGDLQFDYYQGYGVNSVECFRYCNFDIMVSGSTDDVFFRKLH